MKRILLAALFVVLLALSLPKGLAVAQSTQHKGNSFEVKHGLVAKQGQAESFSQGIGTTKAIRLGDETNNITLSIILSEKDPYGIILSEKDPHISVKTKGRLFHVLTGNESRIDTFFDRIPDPSIYEFRDRLGPYYVEWTGIGKGQGQALLLKDGENYWLLSPIKYVPEESAAKEDPKTEGTAKKNVFPWKSVICEWIYWRPATEQEVQTTAAARQRQLAEAAQKFTIRRGKCEFDPKIRTSDPWGNSCFYSTNHYFNVGDIAGNLRLRAMLGDWPSSQAFHDYEPSKLLAMASTMKIEIRDNLQYYLCTPEENALGLDKLDPRSFNYQDKVAYYKNLPLIDVERRKSFTSPAAIEDFEKWNRKLEHLKNNEEEIKEMPLWITVAKDQVIWFKSINSYTGLKPTEFVYMYNSVDEMPKIYQGDSWRSDGKRNSVRTRNPGWKEKWPYSSPPPIWKSVKCEWVRWTPARNPQDTLVLRTLLGNEFSIAGVIFTWDSPGLNPDTDAGSDSKPKPLTLSYKAKYTSMSFCLLKQSDISSVDLSQLEFRQAPLDRNYAGSISLETGDVLVLLLDKDWLALKPVRVEKSGQFTAVFYERRRGPKPSVASVN